MADPRSTLLVHVRFVQVSAFHLSLPPYSTAAGLAALNGKVRTSPPARARASVHAPDAVSSPGPARHDAPVDAHELSIRGGRVVTPDGVRRADILISGGRIAEVCPPRPSEADESPAGNVVDAAGALVLPGLVDTHVHVNEPGRTHWEGFASATDAAAAGGITTIVDMPLNSSPVTTTLDAFEAKLEAARGQLRVDCGFWGGVVPGNVAELEPLAEAGVLGFKCFLADSGLPEFPAVEETDLRPAMREIARLGLPLLVHAELPGPIAAAASTAPDRSRRYADWLSSRPATSEVAAVRLLVDLVGETGCPVHVVHVSAAGSLPVLDRARAAGLPITAETCPHYLALSGSEIPDGATTYKCAPPIRSAANRDLLWEGLRAGVLDLVASDHSPCPPEDRAPETGDFFAAWGGIASLQLGLSLVWSAGRPRGVDLSSLVAWMSEAPARLAGLSSHKGRIAAGYDADLIVFDPDAEYVVDSSLLRDRHGLTPYDGMRLTGLVRRTLLAGRVVFADGEPCGSREGRTIRGRSREE